MCRTSWGSTRGTKDISLLKNFQAGSRAQPVSYSVATGRALFLGVKWSGLEVKCSSASSAEVKNEQKGTCASPVFLHGVSRYNWRDTDY